MPFLSDFVTRTYMKIFSRPSMQRFNNHILHWALRSSGYNNWANQRETGEATFIKLLSKFNPKLCLDVGANKGNYALLLLTSTNSKVISFDPLPKAFKSLEDIRTNYRDRFECFNVGIADQETYLKLHFGEEDSEFASFSAEVNNIGHVGSINVNTMDVKVITLDNFLSERNEGEIDLIKIDTEGYEYEVLKGAAKTIRNNPPKFVQIEYNTHQLFRNQSLYSLGKLLPGYKAYQLLPFENGMAARNADEPIANYFQFSNFVFVRPDIAAGL